MLQATYVWSKYLKQNKCALLHESQEGVREREYVCEREKERERKRGRKIEFCEKSSGKFRRLALCIDNNNNNNNN